MVSCDLYLLVPAQHQQSRAAAEVMLCTLIEPGDSGLTSSVANAGELVSPALISPPSPLDRLRVRVLSLLLGPVRGPSLSVLVVESRGNASVAVMVEQFESTSPRANERGSISGSSRCVPVLQRSQNGVII